MKWHIQRTIAPASLAFLLATTGCASTSGGSRSWLPTWLGGKDSSATSSYLEGMGAKKQSPLEKMTAGIKGVFVKPTDPFNAPKSEDKNDPTSLANPAKPSAEFYVSVARMHESSGNTGGAIEQYNKALEMSPDNLGAMLGLALMHDRQGKFDEAAKYYTRAAEKHPNQAAVLNNLGLCYARQGKLSDAARTLNQSVQLQPNKSLYRNNLANVLIESNQIDQALAVLTPISGEATAHYNVGYLLNKRGRSDEALAHFRQALAVDPSLVAAQTWIQEIESGVTTEIAKQPSTTEKLGTATAATSTNTAPTMSTPVQETVSPAAPVSTAKLVAPPAAPVAVGSGQVAIVSDQPGATPASTGVAIKNNSRSRIEFSRPTAVAAQPELPGMIASNSGSAPVSLDQPTGMAGATDAPPDIVDQPEKDVERAATRVRLEGSKWQ